MGAVSVVEQQPEFSRQAAAVMGSDHVLNLPPEQQWALREAFERAETVADLPEHLRVLFRPDTHAAIVESEAEFEERLHPRNRRGEWIAKYLRGGGELPRIAPEHAQWGPGLPRGRKKRGRMKGRHGPVKASARGWRDRVEELRGVKVLPQKWLTEARQHKMKQHSAAWEATTFEGKPAWEKNGAMIVASLRDDADGLRHGYEVFYEGRSLGWHQSETGEAAQTFVQRVAPQALRDTQDAIDDWYGLAGQMRGSFQSMGGDPGVMFEAQHHNIMEAGALIDAEVTRRVKPEADAHRAAVRAWKTQLDVAQAASDAHTQLGYETVRDQLVRHYGWPESTTWEDVQKRRIAARKQEGRSRFDPKTTDRDLARDGGHIEDLWNTRYNDEPRLQGLYDREAHERWDVLLPLIDQKHVAEKALSVARRTAAYAVLGEVRPFGGGYAFEVVSRGEFLESEREQAKQAMRLAGRWLPQDWLQTSDLSNNPLWVTWTANRGHYQHMKNSPSELLVSPSPGEVDGEGTALHEMVHRIEAVRDGVKGAEWTFYTSRVSPGINKAWEPLRTLREVTGNNGYAEHEKTRTDDFTHSYSGKTYGDDMNSSYEILSMGIEDLVTGQHKIIGQDDDYRHFVFGSLALL